MSNQRITPFRPSCTALHAAAKHAVLSMIDCAKQRQHTMSEKPVRLTEPPAGYAAWLTEQNSVHTAQQRATLAVNRELVLLYWQIGRDILA